jgi:hypothetical protein
LGFQYNSIIMMLLSVKNDKFRLTLSANFNLKHFRTKNGRFPIIIFLNQIKYQIQKRICASIGIDALFIGY